MIYFLILLTFITFLLAFGSKLLITYSFIKFFNRAKTFWLIVKPILFYELGVFCFFIVNPVSLIYLLTPLIPRPFLFPLYFLISVILLFLIFKFIMQKFSLLNFKKSLLIFFLIFFIITPVISFSRGILDAKIVEKLQIFEKPEIQEMLQRILFPRPRLKSFSEIILEKTYKLNDIFLQEKLWRELREFIFIMEI